MRRADEGQRGLRIRLSLGETPELLDVPWEFLYRRPTFLASQRRTPVVRFIDIGTHEALASLTGPVRILAVVANPVDLETLNVAAERALVQRALSGLSPTGLSSSSGSIRPRRKGCAGRCVTTTTTCCTSSGIVASSTDAAC